MVASGSGFSYYIISMMIRITQNVRHNLPMIFHAKPVLKNKIILLLLLLVGFLSSTCGAFQKAERIRKQNVRNAAAHYAAGNWIERRDAVINMATYIGPEGNDLITMTLLMGVQDISTAVRIEALKGLMKLKSERTLGIIKIIALEDMNENVRYQAIKTLHIFNDVSIAEVYIKGMDSDDWLIREGSITGILMMDYSTIKSKLIPSIIKAIKDPRSSITITTLRSIKVRDDALYQAIAEKFNACTDNNYSLLEASLLALDGYKLDPKTKQKAINLLTHDNTTMRVLALRVLKKDQILNVEKKNR